MVEYPKTVFGTHSVSQFGQSVTLKLHQFPALGAVKVVMLGVSVVVFKNGSTVQLERIQQASVDKLFQRAINGRSAHVARFTLPWKVIDQHVGIEMFVPAEDEIDQIAALFCMSQTATLKIFLKALLGRQ
jgi:hypothetical protein